MATRPNGFIRARSRSYTVKAIELYNFLGIDSIVVLKYYQIIIRDPSTKLRVKKYALLEGNICRDYLDVESAERYTLANIQAIALIVAPVRPT